MGPENPNAKARRPPRPQAQDPRPKPSKAPKGIIIGLFGLTHAENTLECTILAAIFVARSESLRNARLRAGALAERTAPCRKRAGMHERTSRTCRNVRFMQRNPGFVVETSRNVRTHVGNAEECTIGAEESGVRGRNFEKCTIRAAKLGFFCSNA